MKNSEWTKTSWKNNKALQQPHWPDKQKYEAVLNQIAALPALVFAGETRLLKQQLAEAVKGNVFVLHCGDCAEEFSRCTGPHIHALIKVILQISVILAYAGEKRVVNIGRMAGQYVKPRSEDTEVVNNEVIPVYRGDMINAIEPTLKARTPDPQRVLEGYFRSTATLNLVRAFTRGGYAALNKVESWHHDFADVFQTNLQYAELVNGIKKALAFFKASGLDHELQKLNEITLFTSHEALLLGYEEAMTRIDTTTGDWYDTSAHLLWVGERTRQHHGAHVEFLRGVNNPIGVKVGPDFDLDDIKKVFVKLNPNNEAGRIAFITRFGYEKIDRCFPSLLKEIKREGFNVVWVTDPMHGNTFKSLSGRKTRKFKDLLREIRLFFEICHSENSVPGGVHLELTGEKVTECLGGINNLKEKDLELNYRTACDPRLNAEQAVEMAFQIADLIK